MYFVTNFNAAESVLCVNKRQLDVAFQAAASEAALRLIIERAPVPVCT